jgi:hypothetical protein
MQVRRIAPSSYEITGPQFGASVQLNARDCMVAATILEVPQESGARAKALAEFKEKLYKEFGAKSALRFKYKQRTEEDMKPFMQDVKNENAVLTTRENLLEFIKAMQQKEKIVKIAENTEYELISDPAQLSKMAAEIDAFKSENAPFTNDTPLNPKRKKGIYSPTAEKAKNENPAVKQFVLRHKGKIIATNMFFTSAGVTYESDIIVHKDYRNKGFCQYMMWQGYATILANPKIKFAWIITGGEEGQKDVRKHLYKDLLQAEPMTKELALKHGFIVNYMKEGWRLLSEANRDLTTGLSLDGVKSSRAGLYAVAAAFGAATVTVGGQLVSHMMKHG